MCLIVLVAERGGTVVEWLARSLHTYRFEGLNLTSAVCESAVCTLPLRLVGFLPSYKGTRFKLVGVLKLVPIVCDRLCPVFPQSYTG